MSSVTKLLDEKVLATAKRELKLIGKNALLTKKLEAVIAVKKHSISKVASVYDISRSTLTRWIKHIKNNELEKLRAPKERRRKSKLNEEQRKKIGEWIKANSQLTIKAVRILIESEFSVIVSKSTVHREIRKLKYSYITPRPQHYKQDKNKVDEFKKKYQNKNL